MRSQRDPVNWLAACGRDLAGAAPYMHSCVVLHTRPCTEQSTGVEGSMKLHVPMPSHAKPEKETPSAAHEVAPHAVPAVRGWQVPGAVLSVQLTQFPMHSLSQQTPSAPQTPLAHCAVAVHVTPGLSLVWQVPFAAQ
jgi:hypothetical protein